MSSCLTGLSQVFGNVSNPQHLFQSPTHAAALRLLSGVPEETRNIRILTGEPGVGKTIILLHHLEQLQHSAFTAHLLWTQLGRDEFLRYFLHELGVPDPATEIAQGQEQLTRALEREFCQGRRVIVAIDEAQNLEIPALQALSELLDCNLARSKEMEVVLAGFPELQSKLASPGLRRIRDRISAIVSLSPLTADETASYITQALELSGYHGDGLFSSDALTTIATLAEGIPRNINNICFAALYVAEKRACSLIDSSIVLEAAAQQQSRLITHEITQPWIAALADFPTEHVTSDQQTCGSAQLPSSIPDLISGMPVAESAPNTVIDGWVDDQTRAVPDRICRWFSDQRVAWSGTVGELAAAVDQPEPEVVHALHANSDILRNFGILVSVRERAGRTRSVSLRRLEQQEPRRLEQQEQTTAEEVNPGLRLSESEVDTPQAFEADHWPAENLPSEGQPRDGLTANALTEAAPEAAPVSPADQALDLLRADLIRADLVRADLARANHLQHNVEARVSLFRWAVPVLLLAIATGLVWRYSPVLKRRYYAVRLAQQHTEAKAVSKAMIAGGKRRGAVPGNTQAKVFSTREQESPHVVTAPPASASAQSLSGTRVLQQNGGPPDGSEATTSFRQAALSGDPKAQFELGAAYALGRGVPADPVGGYTWLTLAVANGDRQAETLIRELTRKLSQSDIARVRWTVGEMYANGIGVHPDKVTAYMWDLLAESAGESRSTVARSRLASTMTDDERAEARARASQWLRKHHR